ncbi:hypothetical protein AGABI1DRAFT_124899 [Agaricus bisporus var. burnettii JB137-S8]|uniref:Uncharacterized protein n=1 Tax=Agaricus bisporus var. burnettii (strain JB137-S8 / ATCC MYA-4627 / FGSC 10392) TaxID=597362 RepID=K5X3L2_AGABU|nr:uncharacterized protein AGABI1DRAFT_124899 [Agaricus bisporus var. burnettii JB137-S8]EKM82431.1 hypothetical protein AGABI1DRAFT_124899 [Agaricus bisporus var. burnettii JB137-S8]
MDKSAPWTIAKGTLTICNATATGISSILQRQDRLSVHIAASALNSAITATTFFSLREFVVSPIFVYTLPFEQYERRRREFDIEKTIFATQGVTSGDVNISSTRSNKLLDSAVSGAITGGILKGIKTGTKGILERSAYVGAVCMFLQLAYNEFGIQRLKYISRSNSMETPTLPTTGEPSEDSRSWKEKALGLIGVRRMSSEEYLERMKLQREQYIKRIKELEREREEERNAAETTK